MQLEIVIALILSIFGDFGSSVRILGSNDQNNRFKEVVKVVGEELGVLCDLETDHGGLIVWKFGDRVLFAGSLRVRRDFRIAVQNKKYERNNV